MEQLGIRLLVLLGSIIVNIYLLTNAQAFSGDSSYAWAVIAFNAVLLFVIYTIDLFIVTMRRYKTRIEIGERVIKGRIEEV